MLRLLLALALTCLTVEQAQSQQPGPIYCSQQATTSLASTVKKQIIAADGVARIMVCGYTVSAAAATVITFQNGTGTDCGTTSAAFGPTVQLGTTSTTSDDSFVVRQIVPATTALCATSTGNTANITVYYTLQ